MKGFKNTTRTQYSMGGSCDAYAKGGSVKGAAKVAKVMGEFKKGDLHSGSKEGPKVTKPAQAKAIAMSEARKADAKAPVKKNEGGKIGKMPPIGESVKSGNRASKMTAAEMREMEKRFSDKKRPSPADSAKSANRVSSQEAAEARHLGVFKNGGKVAKYAEGGPVGQPQPVGAMPQGVGQKLPRIAPMGQPSASGSFNAMQQSLNQVGGPQSPTLASTGQSLGQFAQQEPQMGMTPQQRSFGISGGPPPMGGPQAQQIYDLNNQLQAQGRPGMLGFSPEQMQQALGQIRQPMTPQSSMQRQLQSQGMQVPNWMKGKADTQPAAPRRGGVMPLPSPKMPPQGVTPMPSPKVPQQAAPMRQQADPRPRMMMNKGGLTAMPKKGKC
jgi:hypothetical protein